MEKDTQFLDASKKLLDEIVGMNEIVEELQKWCNDYERHLPRDKVSQFLNISVRDLVDKQIEILKILMELLQWCIDNGNFNPSGVEEDSVKDLQEKLSGLQKAREVVKQDVKHHFDTLVAELPSDSERDESAGPSDHNHDNGGDHNKNAPETATSSPSTEKDTRFLDATEKVVHEIAGTNKIVETLQKWCKDYESHLPRDKVSRFLNISVRDFMDKEAEILKILMELLNWCIDIGDINPWGVDIDRVKDLQEKLSDFPKAKEDVKHHFDTLLAEYQSAGERDDSAGPSDHNHNHGGDHDQNAPETVTSSPSSCMER